MADVVPSANMSLPVPVVGVDPGPQYASDINACFTILDAHDHSAGNGVQITPAGLNINADLLFNTNNLTLVKSVNFTPQSAVLVGASDLGCLYEVGVDLYYNDGSGNNVRITKSGGVAGSPGSIANLTSPASATYVSANQTFVWQSAASTPANLDGGSFIFRKIVASSPGITMSAPTALAADYAINLPAVLPASQKFLSLDASGNMAANWAVDNSTLEVSSNTVQVKNAGITRPKLASLGQQLSASSGNFLTTSTSYVAVTNLSVNITTTGRPVMLMIVPESGNAGATISVVRNSSPATATLQIIRDLTTPVSEPQLGITNAGASTLGVSVPPGSLNTFDPIAAGTYRYDVFVKALTGATSVAVVACKLLAFEIG